MALALPPRPPEDILPLVSSNHWDNLPTELFDHLLSRLPVKVIARCRFVCKVWLRIIDCLYPWMKDFNPGKSYIFGCSADDVETTGPVIYGMIEKGDEMIPKRISTFPKLRGFRHGLPGKVNSSDGLILLERQEKSRILESAVINPLTKEVVVMPGSPYEPVAFDNLTLGYDPWSGSHKVVQLLVRDENNNLGAAIYNLRGERCWRFIPFPDWLLDYSSGAFENRDQKRREGVCVSATLFWTFHGRIRKITVCFDLSRDKFLGLEMLVGLWRDMTYLVRFELANEGGCLTLWDLSFGERENIMIWRLVRKKKKHPRWTFHSRVFLAGSPIHTRDKVAGVYHYGRDRLLIRGRSSSTGESLSVFLKDKSSGYENYYYHNGTKCTLNDRSLGRLNFYSHSWDFNSLSI